MPIVFLTHRSFLHHRLVTPSRFFFVGASGGRAPQQLGSESGCQMRTNAQNKDTKAKGKRKNHRWLIEGRGCRTIRSTLLSPLLPLSSPWWMQCGCLDASRGAVGITRQQDYQKGMGKKVDGKQQTRTKSARGWGWGGVCDRMGGVRVRHERVGGRMIPLFLVPSLGRVEEPAKNGRDGGKRKHARGWRVRGLAESAECQKNSSTVQ